jgi:hypothetical protein
MSATNITTEICPQGPQDVLIEDMQKTHEFGRSNLQGGEWSQETCRKRHSCHVLTISREIPTWRGGVSKVRSRVRSVAHKSQNLPYMGGISLFQAVLMIAYLSCEMTERTAPKMEIFLVSQGPDTSQKERSGALAATASSAGRAEFPLPCLDFLDSLDMPMRGRVIGPRQGGLYRGK